MDVRPCCSVFSSRHADLIDNTIFLKNYHSYTPLSLSQIFILQKRYHNFFAIFYQNCGSASSVDRFSSMASHSLTIWLIIIHSLKNKIISLTLSYSPKRSLSDAYNSVRIIYRYKSNISCYKWIQRNKSNREKGLYNLSKYFVNCKLN